MILRMIIQFVMWSRGDHVDVPFVIREWSPFCFGHEVIEAYMAWPVSQVWDGSCGTWDLRWWLISILVVHIVIISCFIMVAINLINLLNAMLLSCLDAFGCCELASTFNVVTWRVMPDCRWCRDCLIACCGFRSCELDRVPPRVPAEWSSLPSPLFRC